MARSTRGRGDRRDDNRTVLAWRTGSGQDANWTVLIYADPVHREPDQIKLTQGSVFRSLEELGALGGREALRTLEGRGAPGKPGSVEARSASGYRNTRSKGNGGGHMRIGSFNERHKGVLPLLWNVQTIWANRRLTYSKADKGFPRKKLTGC